MVKMGNFFNLFGAFISRIIYLLDSRKIDIFGTPVSIWTIIFILIIITMFVNIWWKGAKG